MTSNNNPNGDGNGDAPDLSTIGSWDDFDQLQNPPAPEEPPPGAAPPGPKGKPNKLKRTMVDFDASALDEFDVEGMGAYGTPEPEPPAAAPPTTPPPGMNPAQAPVAPEVSLVHQPGAQDTGDMDAREIEEGKTMALIAQASGLLQLPLFLIPMITRDNAYALHHAKQAAGTYLAMLALYFIAGGISAATCGVFFFILFLPPLFGMGYSILGLIKAGGGEVAMLPGIGEMSDNLFKNLKAKNNKLPPGPDPY